MLALSSSSKEEGDPETEQVGSEDGYASVGQEEKRDPCAEYSGIVSRAQRKTTFDGQLGTHKAYMRRE